MNKRITELAMSIQRDRHWTEEDIEKFAELMIDEVYSFLLDPSEDDEPWHSRAEVKKHFGVEL